MEAYPNHTFQPDAAVVRRDLADVASRALTLIARERPALADSWKDPDVQFGDLQPGHLSYRAAAMSVDAGVLAPDPDGTFGLTRPVTGAEAVAAVRKLEELAESRTR
jgi:hypothetical protein